MSNNTGKLSGIFAPVVTPFHSDELSLDDLRFNLQRLKETDLTGYLALGSNGEFRSLTDKEQIQVMEVFAEEQGDKIVMVGTACESTRQTIIKSRLACEMGFNYVSILTPSYFVKQIDGIVLQDYYSRIADSINCPVLLYNAPRFAGGVEIPIQTVLDLSRHSNIVGMKDSTQTGPVKLLSHLDPAEDFSVLAGSANFFYPALEAGAKGGVLSLANVIPEDCCRLYRLFLEGRYDEAEKLNSRLIRLNKAVSSTWGVAGVKAAMELVGFRAGEPRHPLQGLPDETKQNIRETMVNEGFISA